jgi:hypothetical protein
MTQPKTQWFAAVAAGLALAASACTQGEPADSLLPDDAQVSADVPAMVADAGGDVVDASIDIALDAAFDMAQEPSCPTDWPDGCVPPVPSWMNGVQAIINKRCYPCHFPDGVEYPRVDLSSYKAVHGIYGPVLSLEKACAMPPPDAAQPTPAEREELVAWLICAAPNN